MRKHSVVAVNTTASVAMFTNKSFKVMNLLSERTERSHFPIWFVHFWVQMNSVASVQAGRGTADSVCANNESLESHEAAERDCPPCDKSLGEQCNPDPWVILNRLVYTYFLPSHLYLYCNLYFLHLEQWTIWWTNLLDDFKIVFRCEWECVWLSVSLCLSYDGLAGSLPYVVSWLQRATTLRWIK